MIDLSGPLGLCLRARACSYGFENALNMMRKERSFLILLSDSASNGTKKRITDKCKFYNVELVELDLSDTFNRLKIKESVKIVSINDYNFKKLIDKRIKGET